MSLFWTIQTQAAWDVAQQRGQLKADPQFIRQDNLEDPEFYIRSYDWLVRQMANRLESFDPANYPIWLWPTKPDLRHRGHLPSGQAGVRLTVEIPSQDVVLSDFDAWSCLLNGSYLPVDEQDERSFELRRKASGVGLGLAWLQDQFQQEIEDSWSRIFDLNNYLSEGYHQATTGPISLDKVVKVEHFIAR